MTPVIAFIDLYCRTSPSHPTFIVSFRNIIISLNPYYKQLKTISPPGEFLKKPSLLNNHQKTKPKKTPRVPKTFKPKVSRPWTWRRPCRHRRPSGQLSMVIRTAAVSSSPSEARKGGVYMDVSKNSGFSPQIIHLNRVFHYKSSILGYHYFGNTHINHLNDPCVCASVCVCHGPKPSL